MFIALIFVFVVLGNELIPALTILGGKNTIYPVERGLMGSFPVQVPPLALRQDSGLCVFCPVVPVGFCVSPSQRIGPQVWVGG